MESRALVFCLDDVPGADELFDDLEPRARRFVCVAGPEDVVERVFADLPEWEDDPSEADAADAASDWLDEVTFSDLFEPTWDELEEEPEIDIVAAGVVLDDVVDALRSNPHVRLLRDRVRRDGELDPRIRPQLDRLGATLGPPAGATTIPFAAGEHPVPEPMRRFLYDVTWPTGSVYTWFDWYGGGLRFDVGPFLRPTPVEGQWPQTAGAPLVVFAHANGGTSMLLVRLDDPDPADPTVYRLDADEHDELPFRMATLARLLADLHRDVPEDATRPPR